MNETDPLHPRVRVETYLASMDELDESQRALTRAQSVHKSKQARRDEAHKELNGCVGANQQRRVFHFDSRAVVVSYVPDEEARIEILKLE